MAISLGPLEEVSVQETHRERSYNHHSLQEEEGKLQVGDARKAVLNPAPCDKAATANASGNPAKGSEEHPCMRVAQPCTCHA